MRLVYYTRGYLRKLVWWGGKFIFYFWFGVVGGSFVFRAEVWVWIKIFFLTLQF